MQTSLFKYYKNPKPLHTLLELSMAKLPSSLPMTKFASLRNKLDSCRYCGKIYIRHVSSLCKDCRQCNLCGLSTRVAERDYTIDNISRVRYLKHPPRVHPNLFPFGLMFRGGRAFERRRRSPRSTCNLCFDVWKRRPFCGCCKISRKLYEVPLYNSVTGKKMTGTKCEMCIRDERCYECGQHYYNLATDSKLDEMRFVSVYSETLLEDGCPTARTMCGACWFKNFGNATK
ncbi:hypothetical protein [Alphabaculovirus myunipunctae]|uniref:Uncharacterized protein n=1 Tax=Mythimna unipuncta nucleopolyhedrovirus TaxID=447897 RepID=A0A2K9VS58_9ABAC|nr:hypothetical protein [Mythimna unipuncta nucleopolyhedrovirus]AUV65298.1 hypothetical protein [Mythimna unipuncta nucleopolyhedrovirus]